jgi:hypothetical protein
LLIIAGGEGGEVDFAALLMDQVDKLRKQLDEEQGGEKRFDRSESGGESREWHEPESWMMGVHSVLDY